MSEIVVRLGHHAVAIELPGHLLSDGILTSLKSDAPATTSIAERIIVSETGNGSFELATDGGLRQAGLKRGALLERLLSYLADRFARVARGPVLRAAAVSWSDSAVLLAGPEACGKSSLAAWFIENGFALVGDDELAIVDAAGSLSGYPTPFTFAAGGADHLVELAEFSTAPLVRTREQIYIGIKEPWRASGETHACGMVIFPRYAREAQPRLEKLEAASAALLLKAQMTSPGMPAGETDFWHIEMARGIPAVALTYSHYDQISGLLDPLVRLVIDEKLSASALDRFVAGIGRSEKAAPRKYPVPERSTRELRRFMTIGMATYDDYDGVYFSLQAIRFYHPEILDDVEFLVIDNHPDGPCSAALKDLEKHIPNLRYSPAGDVTGTAVRERVFREAQGDFVLCMDCHVLFAPGSLRKLIDYFRSAPASIDLVQGPMIYDDLARISTHWAPAWQQGFYGHWANDPAGDDPEGPPFDIPSQGLGVFACRRAAWPGFNPAFRGFGGEEGYIQEKFRQAGGRSLCLPALRWLHRFGRPMGASYPNKWEDRIRNYLLGFGEIGWDTAEMQDHFRERLGRRTADRIFAAVGKELAGEEGADDLLDGDDEPYDLNEARLRFVADVTVPVLLENFAVDKVACIGRAAGIWTEVFGRYGISASVTAVDAPDQSYDLACCFEPAGISSAALAEQYVMRLSLTAPVIVFAFAQAPAGANVDYIRLRASWAALFARRGYRPIDCLRPVLAEDPRADKHYKRNLIVFSRTASVPGSKRSAAASQKTEPGVSVILPVYNGAEFLGQAIESILLQSHKNFELIIVNDGSRDKSGAIAENYAKVDKRVRVIHQDNAGEAAAFNAGSDVARFALLARMDHDDVALPERLALQVAFLEKNKDIAAVGGAMRAIDRAGKPTGGRLSYPLTPEDCRAVLVNSTVGPIGNPSAMMRKAAFDQCGGYRVQFRTSSDFDLWLRMGEEFNLANLADAVVDYRWHGANATSKSSFSMALSAHIAKQSAILRRRGEPDPVNGWSTLELGHLSTFAMPEEEKSRTYRELFDAALVNFAVTSDRTCLELADKCLSLLSAEGSHTGVNA